MSKEILDQLHRKVESYKLRSRERTLFVGYLVYLVKTGKEVSEPEFSFIKDSGLITEELTGFIRENLDSILSFDFLTYSYLDATMKGSSDKKVGFVPTPSHIVELFGDLVDLKSEDIVLDTTAGMGSLLVPALQLGCEVIGVEFQRDMYLFLMLNTLVHGESKSTIYNSDCFKEELVEDIRQKKPTVGLLNPPYKSLKTDIEEIDFMLNSLDMLEEGGRFVTIVPMSIAIGTGKGLIELKGKILEKHTLRAVLSMTDQLFSPVSVNTCIIVIEAHKPHPKDYKTFFGYFKEDGLEKRKNKGRLDSKGLWKGIKEDWLDLYRNNISKSGSSCIKEVTREDEWLVEAYMQTDYSKLTQEDFEKTVRNYVAYLIQNGDKLDDLKD